MTKPTNRAFILAFLMMGLGAMVGGGYWFVQTLGFKSSAARADGVVVKLESRRSSGRSGARGRGRSGGPSFAPVFEFKDAEGGSHRVTSSVSSRPAAYDVGEKVAVLYSPGDPEDARIDSFFSLWGGPCALAVVGFLFTLVSTIVLVKQRRRL